MVAPGFTSTEPPAAPANVIVSERLALLNVAVTLVFAVMAKEQPPVPEQGPPDQPSKVL